MNPPPLPGAPPPTKTIFHQCAAAALAAPLIAIIVSFFWNASRHGQPESRASSLIMGGLAVALVLLGLVLAIVALCGITRHGKSGLLGRGLAGVLINGVLLVAMAGAVLAAFGRGVRQRNEAWAEMDAATRDMRASLRTNYNAETGITNDMAAQLGEYQSRLASAAQKVTGDDALIMQATVAFTARMQEEVKRFSTVVSALTRAEPANFATLTGKGQIEERRKVVQDFLAANQTLKEFLAKQDAVMEGELQARKVPARKIEECMAGFRRSQAPMLPKLKAIRATDDAIGESMLKLLDIAEAQWGKWSYDPQTELTTFENDQAAEEYNEVAAKLQKAADDQIRLQGEMIKLQQRAGAARN